MAERRLENCPTACSQSSADRFRLSRIGGAFFAIAPRFPGFNWRICATHFKFTFSHRYLVIFTFRNDYQGIIRWAFSQVVVTSINGI